jgi:hypothetical protein
VARRDMRAREDRKRKDGGQAMIIDWIGIKWNLRAALWGLFHPFSTARDGYWRACWAMEKEFAERDRKAARNDW